MTLPGSTLLLLLLSGAALAQPVPPPAQDSAPPLPALPGDPTQIPLIDRDVKARAGRETRVVVLTNVKPDCTSGPLPNVRLISPPANGKIAVRRGRFRATNVRQCLAIEVPALIAFYRSAPDFQGSDTVILEIRPEQGTPQIRRVTITVTKIDDGSNI